MTVNKVYTQDMTTTQKSLPTKICPGCSGTGIDPAHEVMPTYCRTCKGAGRVLDDCIICGYIIDDPAPGSAPFHSTDHKFQR